jgi:predicted dehydrogenase
MENISKGQNSNINRRNFVNTPASISLAGIAAMASSSFAAGSDKLRVGLIGCGGRGTGAAMDCVNSSENVEIVAMGDIFKDHLDESLAKMSKIVDDKVNVTNETSFTGFDAYKKVLACDIDMVILGTPPHFRPIHLKAAIEAGKHVFMEKPVAVDPVGIRSVIESSLLAKKKKLAIVAGTQRRHQDHYLQIMKKIHDGDIGEIKTASCYWNQGGLWVKPQRPEWSDMEWQCRNWLYFTWLSGDHITEQHVHNLDVVNWAIGSHPIKCTGIGGRQVRTAPEYGNIYDHFTIEYEYPNGIRVMSTCRQTKGCSGQVSEFIQGTKGSAYTDSRTGYIEGEKPFKYEGKSPNPYEQEHADLIASIRKGEPLNEGIRIAESTLTAIMGRMSAYTGRALKWDWVLKSSKLDLSPEKYEFGPLAVREVAIPGKTPLI